MCIERRGHAGAEAERRSDGSHRPALSAAALNRERDVPQSGAESQPLQQIARLSSGASRVSLGHRAGGAHDRTAPSAAALASSLRRGRDTYLTARGAPPQTAQTSLQTQDSEEVAAKESQSGPGRLPCEILCALTELSALAGCQWPSVSPQRWPRSSRLVAMVSPRWWPSDLPTRGHRFSPPERAARNRKTRHRDRPREEWIAIPVPAIIDRITFDRVRQVSHDNSKWNPRGGEWGVWLLRGLIECNHCHLGCNCHRMRGRNGTGSRSPRRPNSSTRSRRLNRAHR